MPDDYAGMRRLNAKVQSTRMATGEHESTRYGFELLAEYKAADVWQPDMHWCGGLTELRWIDALARSHNIPVIPHTALSALLSPASLARSIRERATTALMAVTSRKNTTGGSISQP